MLKEKIEMLREKHSPIFASLKDAPNAEIIKAGTYFINEYITEEPDMIELAPLLFSAGTMVGTVLRCDVGFKGEAYVHAPGSAAVFTQPFNKILTAEAERISWMYKIDVAAVRQGNIVKLMEDAKAVRNALYQKMFKMIWDVVSATITSASPVYATDSTVNKTTLDAWINKMHDIGEAVAIIGRSSLISQISTMSGFSNFTQRQVEVEGWLGQYRGIKLIEIKSYNKYIVDASNNEFTTAQVPADKLVMVAGGGGFFGQSGLYNMSGPDVERLAEISHTALDFACVITDARKVGVYEIA